MRIKNILVLFFVLALLAGCDSSDAQVNNVNKYIADFVCGQNPMNPNRIQPGKYSTAVNILNTNDGAVDVTLRASFTFPPGTDPFGPGQISGTIDVTLDPDQAFNVDCEELPLEFPGLEAIEAPYILGLLTVESANSISVSAIYTASDLLEGGGVSIDRERIEAQ